MNIVLDVWGLANRMIILSYLVSLADGSYHVIYKNHYYYFYVGEVGVEEPQPIFCWDVWNAGQYNSGYTTNVMKSLAMMLG